MPRPRPPYPPEFGAEAARLIRSAASRCPRSPRTGRVRAERAGWIKQADLDEGAVTTAHQRRTGGAAPAPPQGAGP